MLLSSTVGVCHIVAHGDEEDALAPMGGTDVQTAFSSDRPAGVSKVLQVTQDDVRAAMEDSRNVLTKDEARAQRSDEAGHFEPEPGAVAFFEAGFFAGVRRVLARESADDGVKVLELFGIYVLDV